MFTDEEICFYNENGYIIKKILTEDECNQINEYVDKNDLNAYYETIDPNIKFGYKHEESEKTPVNYLIRKNKLIEDIGKKILKEYEFSVIRSYYKNDFIVDRILKNKYTVYDSTLPRLNTKCKNKFCITNIPGDKLSSKNNL